MHRLLGFVLILFVIVSCKTTQQGGNSLFTLSGNNPFWSAEISKGGIVFEELGREKITYPYVKGESSNGRTIFLTNKIINGEKNWLKITLVKQDCQDYIAGNKKLPYQVEIEKDGRTFYGCGKE